MYSIEEYQATHYRTFVSRHPKFLGWLKEKTSFLPDKVSNGQRLWHFLHNDYTTQKCRGCGGIPNWHKTKGYVSCSRKCTAKVIEQTNMKRYGVKNTMDRPDIVQKMVGTMNKKYGHNTFLQTIPNPVHDPEYKSTHYKKLREETWDEDKRREFSNLRKSQFTTEEWKEKSIEGSRAKFGVDNPMQDKSIREMRATRLKRYREAGLIIESSGIKGKSSTYSIQCGKCGETINIRADIIDRRLILGEHVCTDCNPVISSSLLEKEVNDYVQGLGYEVESNTRSVIAPLELDIYLPALKLGIEFNGMYWHSNQYKDRMYHQEKWKQCDDKGVRLIQVWEHDWYKRRDIVESIICSAIGDSNKLYARKCEVKELHQDRAMIFLQDNHIQGPIYARIYYGLFHNEELVQLMSFTKKGDHSYEISRSCTSKGLSVVGGFSKLLKHFIKSFDPKEIYSFVNLDYFSGSGYEANGFELVKVTSPGYFYSDSKLNIMSRQRCQKHKLVKMGYDPLLSESEIMNERGFFKVYNSGNKLYKLNIK